MIHQHLKFSSQTLKQFEIMSYELQWYGKVKRHRELQGPSSTAAAGLPFISVC